MRDGPPPSAEQDMTPVVDHDVLPDGRRITYYGPSTARVGPTGTADRVASPPSPGMRERRLDPTTGEWVTFSSGRQDRTYQPDAAGCPLCPTPAGGPETEIPRSRFEIAVLDNRFPALEEHPPAPAGIGTPLTPAAPALGACEVVVYGDDHHATLATLGEGRVTALVDVWAARTAALGSRPGVAYVMPFENHGAEVGATLAHPHGQIYGYPDVPPRPARELRAARDHRARHGTCLRCDLVAQEDAGARVVATSAAWLAVVPWWARWPYQVQLWPRRHAVDLMDLSAPERRGLAGILLEVIDAYDGLWGFSLPYVMVVHQRPTDRGDWDAISHLYVELSPPHRGADRRKHLAGSELGAGAYLTDVVPEDAAAQLRASLDAHQARR